MKRLSAVVALVLLLATGTVLVFPPAVSSVAADGGGE
jgi:hypothetical protein